MKIITKLKWSYIHNWSYPSSDFDGDLVACDRVEYNSDTGEVEWAERIFRIPSPHWLRKIMFGPDIPK